MSQRNAAQRLTQPATPLPRPAAEPPCSPPSRAGVCGTPPPRCSWPAPSNSSALMPPPRTPLAPFLHTCPLILALSPLPCNSPPARAGVYGTPPPPCSWSAPWCSAPPPPAGLGPSAPRAAAPGRTAPMQVRCGGKENCPESVLDLGSIVASWSRSICTTCSCSCAYRTYAGCVGRGVQV